MPKLKWFAVAISAMIRTTYGVRIEIQPLPLRGYTLEEVVKTAVELALSKYPVSSGWYDHQANAVEVPS